MTLHITGVYGKNGFPRIKDTRIVSSTGIKEVPQIQNTYYTPDIPQVETFEEAGLKDYALWVKMDTTSREDELVINYFILPMQSCGTFFVKSYTFEKEPHLTKIADEPSEEDYEHWAGLRY